jgi:hypothetical protein
MALIHADGFDHWSTSGSTTNMTANNYRFFGTTSWAVRNANVRTGPYCMGTDTPGNYSGMFGHTFPHAPFVTVGVGFGMRFSSFSPNSNYGFYFVDNTATQVLSFVVTPLGTIKVYRGGFGATLLGETTFAMNAAAYAFVETKVFSDAVNGSVEIRINNQVALLLTGVNNLGGGLPAGIAWGTPNNFASDVAMQIDDYIVWDDTGLFNNDFLGDIRCRTFFPNGDGPAQDWAHTGATAFGELGTVPYNDAKNINTPTVGAVSNFSKDVLPINTAYVAGVALYTTANKTDAGACNITPSLLSGGVEGGGAIISPGITSATFPSIFETDPNTGNTFGKAAFDAALMQVTRTA